MSATNANGNNNKKTPIRNSINKRNKTRSSEIEMSTDLITIPKMIENSTNPCLYSFLRGLKNVFIRS